MTASKYLAVAGDPQRLREWLGAIVPRLDSSHRLNRVYDGQDLVVYASPEAKLLRLAEERGLVIGRLFRGAEAVEPVERLTLSESRHAAWSRGRSLFEAKWGVFVAFLRDENEVAVVRDPSGRMPVHYCEAAGLHVYFSDVGLLDDLDLGRAPADEEFLRQWLTYPSLRTARTGLSGRFELLPGTVRTSSPGKAVVSTLWSPWTAAAPERRILDFDEASRRVRATTLATIPVQVAGIENPILELSGGLDSSIVATCLKEGGIDFRAANFVTRSADGDERDYAHLVASSLDIELAELPEVAAELDLSPPARRSLRPALSPVLQPLHRALSRHARESGSTNFVTGAGGDNLFCYLTTAAPIVDAAMMLGLRAVLRTVRDVADIGDCTVWKAGRFAVRKLLRGRRRPLWKRDERFLGAGASATEPDPHPWLERPDDPLPGTIEHVESLLLIQHFLDPEYATGEALHHPLLNQPLIELCLAVPTWLWVRGGRNRAVARAAFADLPARIVRRRTKGRLESMCARAYADSRERVTEIVLEGELARRGLVDRPCLESYLRIGARALDDSYFRVFDLVALELWLRSSSA
jgi:asparagine synthase (glutamine-hydrolysing)